ncbi:DUF3696 domain-containing protein [Mycobacteroides abscessus]|uniref:DUF3696 domain-containing protein n=1 Tax=Mycobacteroides abscessus TaxID=36809 RepID=UPI0005E79374|nr:DUF3696 domain-containing protein [Mycobacteroides abscessus]QOF28094.1 hypothetical protein E3G43_001643 [Mycobacteroides abscessus]CPR91936.1 cobalt transporter ATP-binding subunit [Mycobacteroides abscessus]CPS50075.1 cobalt transporter ATP-binding subunit [Mycobacteroides abscessus]CPY47554.1 cobalt transporter ATP-binding subunit [Mycobacteroides abscessus]CPY51026.1 cobalt transporter ATP-binding subunit [Mycobacteroides abscessus]
MIESLIISNFKCFLRRSIEFRPLTILTGLNGGGKSTVLQSILLARLAATGGLNRALELNGPFMLALGEAREVLNPSSSEPKIRFEFHGRSEGRQRRWDFVFGVPEAEQALHLTTLRKPRSSVPGISNSSAGFTYLCAERLGPRDMLLVSAQSPDGIGVGVQGEYTAQVLALRETRQVTDRMAVREPLRHPDAGSALPRLQAEAWLSEIVRPVKITAQWAAGIMASTIRFQETDYYGSDIRPSNTGFGVSYALPIIVAGVLSQPGDMLIVENPEAHLHPRGQSRLGRFLATVAGSGVQVVIETHSDHVVNGVRLAIAQKTSLSGESAVIHYFDDNGASTLRIKDSGEVSHWPAGFFDQIESDLGKLARARRG